MKKEGFIFLLVFFTPLVLADSVYISPAVQEVNLDNLTYVDVYADTSNLYIAYFNLSYNKNILSYINYSVGEFCSENCFSYRDNNILFLIRLFDFDGINGEIRLARFYFQGVDIGDSLIILRDYGFYSYSLGELEEVIPDILQARISVIDNESLDGESTNLSIIENVTANFTLEKTRRQDEAS